VARITKERGESRVTRFRPDPPVLLEVVPFVVPFVVVFEVGSMIARAP
jgi:hypothetical protein